MLGYSEAINIHQTATTTPLELPVPVGRYRNCDVWVLGSLIKDALIRRGEEYLSFPQRKLFDRIGIRRQVLETDPYGNLIFSGCDYGTARNWARLGMLYLQKGVWNNERILPEGWTKFVSTPGRYWKKPEYGGLFWLNAAGAFKMLPRDTYYAAGGGGQYTFIIPKHDLVVVRMGRAPELTGTVPLTFKSDRISGPHASTLRMLRQLMKAFPSA